MEHRSSLLKSVFDPRFIRGKNKFPFNKLPFIPPRIDPTRLT